MRPTFSDLTEIQQATFGNGCGLAVRFLNVPDFIFTASCRQHDFGYARGGFLKAKIKADWDFFIHMYRDATFSDNPRRYKTLSVIYFTGVALNPISYLAFTWGRWRTLEEIIQKDLIAKL